MPPEDYIEYLSAMRLRAAEMVRKYVAGHTLQEVGDEYGLSRERVRQIIKKHGISRKDGGAYLTAEKKRQRLQQNKDRAILRRTGMTGDQWRDHIACYGNGSTAGSPYKQFMHQHHNAARRGIGWDLTFAQWWKIWKQSGKWNQRGRGQGYCMARKGDTGPYCIDTVYICTNAQNCSDQYIWKPYGSDKRKVAVYGERKGGYSAFRPEARGWNKVGNKYRVRVAGKSIGMFKTKQEARSAYLAAWSERTDPKAKP